MLRNITIAQGVNNTTRQKTILHDTVNDNFVTIYANNSNDDLVGWNPADHVLPVNN